MLASERISKRNFRLMNRTVVDDGASLNGTSLYDLRHNDMNDHSVRCLLNIENWTAWRLKDALPHNHCGYIDEKYTAVDVEPATREVLLGHKQVSRENNPTILCSLLLLCRASKRANFSLKLLHVLSKAIF